MRKEKKSAKENILYVSAKVFAEKSFDGARVDEIAKEAGVPKSLIYYHFKSKDEIFEVLTERFLKTYQTLIAEARDTKDAYEDNKLQERMQKIYYPFGIENENLLRAIFIESIKKTNQCTTFFKLVQCLQSDPKKKLDEEEKERLLTEFFFNLIPCMAYICFAEGWIRYFDMQRSEFDTIFLRQYEKMHGDYHRNNQ